MKRDAAWTNRKGFVYFAEAVGSDRIKVGFSSHPQERVNGWKDGCPFSVVLLATIPGTWSDEQRCHKFFAPERKVREWFYASERLRYFIRVCTNANGFVWPYCEQDFAGVMGSS